MNSRHRNKALTGVCIWFAVALAFLTLAICARFEHEWTTSLSGKMLATIICAGVVIQYISFFWGCNHLAKAKGYSNALVIFGIFWPAQLVILTLLLFALPDKCIQPKQDKRKTRTEQGESHIGRIVRYRRNALVGILFGVVGIFFALSLIFFPIPFSTDPSIGTIMAIFVFLAGYAGVICGCFWWVKAKSWIDAVVFIGLVPLAIPMIPYVRLIYKVVPLLLPVSMVIMPLVLIVVVAVLPDKSGMPKRKR